MKKKILASLLAVAMTASLVVPALAYTGPDYNASSVAGLDEEITELVFAKDSYNVAENSTLDLYKELTAYCGDTKIVQEPVLEWDIAGVDEQGALAFGINDSGTVTNIGEKTGTAIVTVKANGKTATTKVVATKGKTQATSWKLSKTTYVTTDGDTTVEVKVVPASDSTEFTQAQYQKIATDLAVPGAVTTTKIVTGATAQNATVNVTASAAGGVTFTVVNAGWSASDLADYTLKVNLGLLKDNGVAGSYTNITRSARIDVQAGKEAVKVVRKSNVELEVGETADLNDYIAYTSGANFGTGVTWTIEPYNDSAISVDYAVQKTSVAAGNEILAVAEGKVKAIATMTNPNATAGNNTATLVINVVKRSAKTDTSTMSISSTTGAIKVGETMAINAKGVAADKKVTWTPSNNNITVTMETTGEGAATITAKAAGTTLLFARVDGEIIGTAKITVTGEGSAVTPPPSDNPNTGDSIFANLF